MTDLDTLAATVRAGLFGGVFSSRHQATRALAALVEHARTLERERDAQRYRADQHVQKWVESNAAAAEARADRYEEALGRIAAAGQVRNVSYLKGIASAALAGEDTR